MAAYQIFTDATADHCPDMMAGLPSVEIIPMEVEIGGRTYTYGPHGDISVQEFYEMQKAGNFATTSQINPSIYFSYFEPCLREGKDILYLCFTSGMSGTIQSAQLCIQKLKAEYPDRIIFCIDTLCASLGEGFLVREAARKQAEGLSIDELAWWVTEHRLQICHWFTVDVFDHLRHGGRVSSAAAAVGTVLQIKPLLHVDDEGKLAVVEKPRGRKRAISTQLARMEQGWNPETSKLVAIGHGDCPDGAQQLKEAVLARFPDAEVVIADIGPIIGAHTGPGMLAVIYWGNNR
ncbi:MAG: DegV family protein [Syntrophomonadaceae bacterium]|jgi:DegV family protein with EDD domain